jgi:uncharacterized protein with von Willebrand factor type A (vWA) domain
MPSDPDLSTPELQLMWGAALAIASSDNSTLMRWKPLNRIANISDRNLWKALVKTDTVADELQAVKFEIANSLRNESVQPSWGAPQRGYPDIAFYFSPGEEGNAAKPPRINLDLPWALICGLENARAISMHEVAHGLGTVEFSPKMQTIRKKMEGIEQGKNRSKDKHLELAKLSAEWNARFMIFDEAENNYANRFTVNRTTLHRDPLDEYLNRAEHAITEIGETYTNHKKEPIKFPDKPDAQAQLKNLKSAIRYAFFANNELFPNNESGWRSIGINPDWIEAKAAGGGKSKITGKAAFSELTALCKKLEDLQPKPSVRVQQGAEAYKQMTLDCSRQLAAVIEEIFDRFAAHLLPQIQKQAEQNMEQKLQEQKDKNQSGEGQEGQKGQGGDKSEQDQGKSEGDDSGKEEGSEGKKGKESKPGKNKDGKKDKGGKDSGNDDKSSGEQDGKDADGQGEEGKKDQDGKGKGKEKPKGKGDEGKESGQGGDDKGDQQQDGNEEGQGKGGKPTNKPGKGKAIVEGIGEVDEVPLPAETPAEAKGVIFESSPDRQNDNEQSGKRTENEKLAELDDPLTGGGGRSYGMTFSDKTPEPPKREGDYDEYLKMIAPHKNIIRSLTATFEKIKQRQTITIPQQSRERSLLPQDGNPQRFSADSFRNRMTKIHTGQNISTSDFKHFKIDVPDKKVPAPIEVAILIDGSGSMQGEPIEAAIKCGCILYEAAKNAGINLHIMMLGDRVPMQVAKPGDSSVEIGKAIERVRRGQGGDRDYLAPALKKTLALSTEKKDQNAYEGKTHVFVVSDGFFTDEEKSMEAVKAISETCPHLTLDFVLIPNGNGGHPDIKDVAKRNNENVSRNQIGCKSLRSVSGIQEGLMDLLNQRLVATKHADAVTIAEKQKEFKKVNGRF